MQVSVEKTSELSRKMTVHLPEELFQEKMQARLKKAASEANLKGFRPGKVPQHVVKKMFGAQIRGEVAQELIESSYVDALTEQKQRPVGQPNIVPDEQTEAGDGFKYIVEFEVLPEISLANIEELEVTTKTATIEVADLDIMIDKLREQKRVWNDSDLPAIEQDRVTINFSGVCDGENFTEGKKEGFPISIGSQQMIPGFEDNLLGLEVGSSKTFELTFPEQYGNEALAGKTATFDVEVNKIERSFLPEIDAEFMQEFGVEENDMALFRSEIQSNMQRELGQAIRANTKTAVLDKLYEKIELSLPKAMIDQEIENLMKPFRENAAQQNRDVNDLNMSADIFEGQAKRRVALSLIMSEIIMANDIKLDEERVRSTIEEMAQSYEDPKELLNYYYADEKQNNLAEMQQLVMEEQAIEWVLGKVKISEQVADFAALMNRNQLQ